MWTRISLVFLPAVAPWLNEESGMPGPMSDDWRMIEEGLWGSLRRPSGELASTTKEKAYSQGGSPKYTRAFKKVKHVHGWQIHNGIIDSNTHPFSPLHFPPPPPSKNCCWRLGSDSGRRLAGENDLAAAGAKNDQCYGKGRRWPPPSPRIPLPESRHLICVVRTEHPTCQRRWVDSV